MKAQYQLQECKDTAKDSGGSSGGDAATSTDGAGAMETSSWLTIVIPTVSRGSVDYISRTVRAIEAQRSRRPADPMGMSTGLLIVDNTLKDKGKHSAFEALRKRYGDEHRTSFQIQPKDGRAVDKGGDAGNANKPGARVRQQTRDLVYTLRRAASSGAKHIFVMEDDFVLCPGGLSALHYMISKAYSMDPDWLAMKVSYGFNGILLRDKDIGAFADYLEKHQARRPPDHLQTEWWAGETPESSKYKSGRSYFVFRYNLLEHIGVQSSLRSDKMVGFGVCGQVMNTELMFQVDAFDERRCADSDMTPCDNEKPTRVNSFQFMANPSKKPYVKA